MSLRVTTYIAWIRDGLETRTFELRFQPIRQRSHEVTGFSKMDCRIDRRPVTHLVNVTQSNIFLH